MCKIHATYTAPTLIKSGIGRFERYNTIIPWIEEVGCKRIIIKVSTMTVKFTSSTKYGVDGKDSSIYSCIDPASVEEAIKRKVSPAISDTIEETTVDAIAIKKKPNQNTCSSAL